jgi:hypothetical protein
MEQSLFMFFFVLSFIMFLISIFYTRDYQLQGIFAGISFVLFAILAIQSLNVENIVYDSSEQEFVVYRAAEHSLEYLVPMGASLVLMIFSLLNVFIIFTYKAWNMALNKKTMKVGGNGYKL